MIKNEKGCVGRFGLLMISLITIRYDEIIVNSSTEVIGSIILMCIGGLAWIYWGNK